MKKRLFISSILMTLVLLVAITTATFAWYKASAGGTLSAGTVESNILTAEAADSYELGENVTLSGNFAAVTGDSYRFQKPDNSYVAMPTYVPANGPTAATFQDVELTDVNGHTWAYNGNQDIDVTSQALKIYGVAKVHLQLSDITLTNLQAIANGSTKTLTITISAAGVARVHKEAPTKTTNGFADADIVLKLTLNADGGYQLNYWTGSALGDSVTENKTGEVNNGSWDVVFYYSVAGTNAQTSSAAESALHDDDKISISIA